MLDALGGYAILLLVPLTCVPVQVLYLKSGQRYDLGAVTYVAAGSFVAANWGVPIDGPIVFRMAAVLVVALTGAFALRVFALTFGRPADFTLISFGQLWSTPALIDYELQMLTKASGVPIEPLSWNPVIVAIGAGGLAAIVAYAITRTDLPNRLVAMTEAPIQYRLLLGSPAWLAFRLEVLAVLVFFLAGVLLRLTINDLSAGTFGLESVWCVLAAALVARSSRFGVLRGPVVATVVRFVIKSAFPSSLATITVYLALAFVLVIVAARAEEASRDATA